MKKFFRTGRNVSLAFFLLSLLPLFPTYSSFAQDLIDVLVSPETQDNWGDKLYLKGDFNGDQTKDYVIPYDPENRFYDNGWIEVRNGKTSQLLYTLKGDGDSDEFTNDGNSIAIGDVNGDGIPDIVVGAPGTDDPVDPDNIFDVGSVFVFDGRNGSELFRFYGGYDGAGLGYAVAVGDINGDGRAEIVASSSETSSSSPDIFVRSGATFSELCRYETNPATFHSEISSLLVGPDLNSDQIPDIVAGAIDLSVNGISRAGKLLLIRGNDCTLIGEESHPQPQSFGQFGIEITDGGDLNGDTKPDLIVHSSTGKFVIKSAQNFTTHFSIDLPLEIAAPGDLNGDGFADLLLRDGEENNRNIKIASGDDFSVLGRISHSDLKEDIEETLGVTFGYSDRIGDWISAHPTFDINGDGFADILATVENVLVAEDDYRTLILVFSGDCPVKPQLITIPVNEWSVPTGANRLVAFNSICGSLRPGRFEVNLNNQTYPLFDNGQNGDATSGDGLYTSTVLLSKGVNNLLFRSSVNNGIEIATEKSVKAVGTDNYSILPTSYDWIPVDGGIELTSLIGKYASQDVQLPFPFLFYGKILAKVYVSSTGLIGIDFGSPNYLNERLPSLQLYGGFIAPFWGPLLPSANARVYTKTVGPSGSRQFVITWEGFEFRRQDPPQQGEASQVTFQAILFEGSNHIKFNFKKVYSSVESKNRGAAGTSGIQANGLLGLVFMHNEQVISDGSAVLFAPSGGSNPSEGGSGSNGGLPGVKFGLKYSAKKNTAKVTLQTIDKGTGNATTLSDTSCLYSFMGAVGSKVKGLHYKQLGSVPAANGSVSVDLKKLPGISSVQATSKKKFGFILAKLTCNSRPGIEELSSSIKFKAANSSAAKTLPIASWLKKVIKSLVSKIK